VSVPAHVVLPPGPTPPLVTPGRSFPNVLRFFRSRSQASRWYLVPMLGLVAFVSALAASAFAKAPVPPGVDPGHWLAISYSYVGLPTAPDPSNQALFYSPLMFPFLGALVRATGNPLVAADILGVGLFALYGLSVVHLARRFLGSGPLQVALVGVAVLSGTTIQMLFWGGYPNLLGFVLMNETLVALLAFVRTRRDVDGARMYLLLGLTFFAHELSSLELFAAFAVSALFLLLTRKVPLRFLLHRANVLGLGALLAVIAGYSKLTARLGISHPSYFSANPAAYYIDQVGELFAPLARAPVVLPYGPPVFLPSFSTAVVLGLSPVVALLTLLILGELAPGRADTRLVLAAASLSAALAVPGLGYLAHVDTDYTRLLYFVPLPFFLVLFLALERAFAADLLAAPARSPGPPAPHVPGPPSPAGRFRDRIRGRIRSHAPALASVAVAVALIAIAGSVTVPVVENNEAASTAVAHDAPFLQAMRWLKSNATGGSVLTVPSAARWTEALSQRDALTVGPVWLLFDPFQITDSQETYLALTSEYAVVGPNSALAFSGFATPGMSQTPMYTAYIEGVPFPVVRIVPASLSLNATGPGGGGSYSLLAGATPAVSAPGNGATTVTVAYSTAVAKVVEVGSAPANGPATVAFDIVPNPGVVVRSLTIGLASPPSGSTTLATDIIDSAATNASGLSVDVSGKLGQFPDRVHLTTSVGFSAAPQWATKPGGVSFSSWTAVVPDPNGTAPFHLALRFSSPGASRPASPLPPVLSTPQFLENRSVKFLLWPNHAYGSVELTYYEATFGFRPAFQNSEWVILGR